MTDTTPQAALLSEEEIVACLVKASCVGTVKMSYESGPYDVDRPSINASRLYSAIESAIIAKLQAATPAEPAHQSTHWTEHEPVRLAAYRVGRVYLAGPMTGYAEFNFPAFNAEAALLRGQGLSVLNPADHGIVDGAGWADYLRHDIAGLASCERIHLLRGWSQSKGAALEVTIAKAIGMAITFQDGAEPSQPVELTDERAAFEVWYASHASNKLGRPFSPHDFYELREGDGYGDAGYLNGAWHGYRAALASVKAPTHTDQAKKDAT